jgi:hypothetical protein
MRSGHLCRRTALLCLLLCISGCATTKEYQGYGGYHTYKNDVVTSKKMLTLALFFTPVMMLPIVYIVNDAYLHNTTISFIFNTIGLSALFDLLNSKLPTR